MLHLIAAASLIYASNAGCTQTNVVTDCQAEQALAESHAMWDTYGHLITVACDEDRGGVCTMMCDVNNLCSTASAFLGRDPENAACDGTYCYELTPSPTAATGTPTTTTTPNPTTTTTPNPTTTTTPNPTTTTAAFSRDCHTTTSECEALLADTVDTVATKLGEQLGVIIPDGLTPATIQEEYVCVDGKCTITCNEPNYGGLYAIEPDTLCGYVEDALLDQGETTALECDTAPADGTGRNYACIATGTGTNGVVPTTTTVDTTTDACDFDACPVAKTGLNDNDDCNGVVPDGYCGLTFDFDVDVCILNMAFRKKRVKEEIKDALWFTLLTAVALDDVCDLVVTQYECDTMDDPEYKFDKKPTDKDGCAQNTDKICTNENIPKFAANIKGDVGIYCECPPTGVDLDDVRDKLIAAGEYLVGFADQFLQLSVEDDPVCGKGFGYVQINGLTMRVWDGMGQQVGDSIDITGGATQMYYYIATFASVVVLVVATFL